MKKISSKILFLIFFSIFALSLSCAFFDARPFEKSYADDDSGVIYFNQNAEISGDGSQGSPYKYLQEALNAIDSTSRTIVFKSSCSEDSFSSQSVPAGSVEIAGVKKWGSLYISQENMSGGDITFKRTGAFPFFFFTESVNFTLGNADAQTPCIVFDGEETAYSTDETVGSAIDLSASSCSANLYNVCFKNFKIQ